MKKDRKYITWNSGKNAKEEINMNTIEPTNGGRGGISIKLYTIG